MLERFVLGPARRITLWGLLRYLKIDGLYRDVLQEPPRAGSAAELRRQLQRLLESVDRNNPFFRGRYTALLERADAMDDATFLERFAELPVLTKADYAAAGTSVMAHGGEGDPPRLDFNRGIRSLLRQLRSPDFRFSMPTGGSTSLPLTVHMNKQHMFAMLFTFFRCWRQMGWRLGDRILVFYPAETYNIDELEPFNRIRSLTGFCIVLFRRVDLETVRQLVATIDRFRPRLLLIFPSTLNRVADLIDKQELPLRYQPPLINVSGETFLDCQRQNIRRVFPRSRVEDSYGSVELGEIAHEGPGGLRVFGNVAYVEQRAIEAGMGGELGEFIITRLHLAHFPFIRYQMRDVGRITRLDSGDTMLNLIEGKDTNFLETADGQRCYPSFFNGLVNRLNRQTEDAIVEVKVQIDGGRRLRMLLVLRSGAPAEPLRRLAEELLQQQFAGCMECEVAIVDWIEHDYRRKYRLIERVGDDVEYAGGIVGDARKMARIQA